MTPTSPSADSPATAQKAARQPACWPRNAPAGTPAMLAMLNPPTITAIARARAVTGTSETATDAPTAQNPAQASVLMTRETNSTAYVGATAPAIWPSPKTVSRAIRVVRRGSRRVAAASTGAPTTMPTANAENSRPAWGMETPMSRASGWSSPESMNSEVPSAKTEHVHGDGHAVGRRG